jgi:peptide/nickel transport system permease protein
VLISIVVLFGITVISFLMIHIAPGSPIGMTLNPKESPEIIEKMERNFHLKDPYHKQYWFWIRDLCTGELKSLKDGQPVLRKIGERLPATIELNIVATIIIFSTAIPLGVFSAARRYSLADHVLTFLAFLGISLPSFWLAYILILFVVRLFGLPVLGDETFGLAPLDFLRTASDRVWHLLLPSLLEAITGIASLSRYMRGSMLEILQQDYIRTARAKGLSSDDVKYKHALRNALLPIITIFGFLIPGLIGGAVIIESIFAWPGIGRLGYESVLSRDYPTIMTLNTITAVLVLLGNLVSDILYAVADPRIAYD